VCMVVLGRKEGNLEELWTNSAGGWYLAFSLGWRAGTLRRHRSSLRDKLALDSSYTHSLGLLSSLIDDTRENCDCRL
jgi:hypothetical protein